ncbi:formate/nitrite transporter [Acetobacter orientalis]|uniref:Formate/nitrite transporter n=1 Tax=Acetobacter orientalis TaxID=146474 RepID=A0A2Z5ZEZ6_9PROT|nr:formate/nitrite transporter [Acetobacter orientalis]
MGTIDVLCPQVKSVRDGVALGQKYTERKDKLCLFCALLQQLLPTCIGLLLPTWRTQDTPPHWARRMPFTGLQIIPVNLCFLVLAGR